MAALGSVVIGTVLAGALAAGIAAAPAQAATASTATASTATATASTAAKHWFSGFSGYGAHESRAQRSSYKGYWYHSQGRYFFDIKVWDRDHDDQATYLDFYYHDNTGWHFGRQSFTDGQDEWAFGMSSDGGRIDGFRVRLGEGAPRTADWGGYYSHSF
jgi:hypothetical protein